MRRNSLRHSVMIIIIAFVVFNPAIAKISDVTPQGTIFIGEEGLNLAGIPVQPNSQVGWWSPGTQLASEPSYLLPVGDLTNFYVNPQIFSGRTGPWYSYPDRILIFYVQDPSLNLRIYDVETGKDRTEGKVVRGDELQFRIDNNLYTLKERPGISGAPITIYVRDDKGITYSSLVNRTGANTALVDIAVDSSSYLTIPLWDTGNDRYSFGTYEIWAECTANHMNDNYPIEGKTITSVDRRSISSIGITAIVSTVTTAITTPTPITTSPRVTTPQTQVTETVTLPPTTVTPIVSPTPLPTTVPPTATPGFLVLTTLVSLLLISGIGLKHRKR